MSRVWPYRGFRRAGLLAVVVISSTIGVPGLGSVGVAHALTGNVPYPLGLCQANLVAISTTNYQPAQGTIALSLGGAPATASECINDGYTNSGVAFTTGNSASSSIAAIALTSCYSIGDYASVFGGGITQCGRGFLANVSVFGDAYGGPPGSLFSFSLLGNASGSFLAIAPFGSASGNAAVGCQAAYGSSNVSWRWCSAWDSALTNAQKQVVYDVLQSLASTGLIETQAVINYYNANVTALSTTLRTAAPPICVPFVGVVPPGSYIINGGIICYDPDPTPPSCYEGYSFPPNPLGTADIQFGSASLAYGFQESALTVAAVNNSYGDYYSSAYYNDSLISFYEDPGTFYPAGWQYHRGPYFGIIPNHGDTFRVTFGARHTGYQEFFGKLVCEVY